MTNGQKKTYFLHFFFIAKGESLLMIEETYFCMSLFTFYINKEMYPLSLAFLFNNVHTQFSYWHSGSFKSGCLDLFWFNATFIFLPRLTAANQAHYSLNGILNSRGDVFVLVCCVWFSSNVTLPNYAQISPLFSEPLWFDVTLRI